MKILRTYLLKELLGPFLISLVILTFVMLMGNMVKMAELVINKGVSIIAVFKLLIFLLPYMLCLTLPMALLTSILLTFGRLSSDNEITTIKSSGISLTRLFIPPIVLGIILSLLSIPLNDQVLPLAHFAGRKTAYEIGLKNPASLIEAGKFIKSFKNKIIFIYEIEKKTNKLKHVRIYENEPGQPTRTIIAESGEFMARPKENAIILKLYNTTFDIPNVKDPIKPSSGTTKTYIVTLPLEEQPRLEDIQKKQKELTIAQLRSEIEKFKTKNLDPAAIMEEITNMNTEIHKKLSISFSCLAFVLIGLPLGITARRSEKSAGVILSIGLIVIYYALLISGKVLAKNEILSPFLSMWMANIILGSLGLVLMIKVIRK